MVQMLVMFSLAQRGKNLPSSLRVFLNDFFWLFCWSLWLPDWRQLSFFIFLLISVITGCSFGCILSTEPCIFPRSLAKLWLMLFAMAILWSPWQCGHCVVISADSRELTVRAGEGRDCRPSGPGQMTDRRQHYLISSLLQSGQTGDRRALQSIPPSR